MSRKSTLLQAFLCVYFVLLALCLVHPCTSHKTSGVKAKRNYYKGIFVFGTSVVDNGNNNNINGSISKANYLPYGIDFPFGPTGRFCNGKTVADKIGDLLYLPPVPPFAAPCTRANGAEIIHGVNYGSGGSGILDDTGAITGGVITLDQQIKNFEEETLPELMPLLGHHANKKIGRYLFLIAVGNNDFELNYLLQPSSSRPSLPIFVANLTSTFRSQLKRLYDVGARKFAILTVYPLGCTPVVKQASRSERCVGMVNKAVHYYNLQLINMVDEFKRKMPGSEFVVVNTYKIIRDIMRNPLPLGFSNVTSPCCELKEFAQGIGVSCKPGGKVCKDRRKYVFFDGQHNTEAVNAIIAAKAVWSHRETEAYPHNLQILAHL